MSNKNDFHVEVSCRRIEAYFTYLVERERSGNVLLVGKDQESRTG